MNPTASTPTLPRPPLLFALLAGWGGALTAVNGAFSLLAGLAAADPSPVGLLGVLFLPLGLLEIVWAIGLRGRGSAGVRSGLLLFGCAALLALGGTLGEVRISAIGSVSSILLFPLLMLVLLGGWAWATRRRGA